MTMTELEQEDTVTEEELFVERGEDDELLPVWQEAPGLDKNVKVLPMTYGAIRRYFGDRRQMDEVSSEDIAEILRNHVVKPNLSDIDAQDIEERMKPMAPQSLVLAVMQASGVDVDVEDLESEEPLVEGN